MNTVFVILAFACVVAFAFIIDKKLTDDLKRYSFICAISCIAVFMYLGTFAIDFYYAQYIIYTLSLTILVMEGIKNKFAAFQHFIKTQRTFFIISLIWFILTIQVRILQWDDFSWGSFVKHLNLYGTYWNSSAAILEQGLRYFPGIALWENFFTGKHVYNEQAIFFGLGLVSVATLHTFIPVGLNSKKLLFFFWFFFTPVSWFTGGYGNISSETMMAMLLGAALCSTLDVKKAEDLFVPFSMAIFLAITKETGFLLSLLIVFLIVVRMLRTKNFFSKSLVFCLLCLVIMLVDFQLWQIYLKKDPHLHTFNSNAIWDSIQQDMNSLSLRSKETLSTFFQALYNRPIGKTFLSRLPLPLFENFKGFYYFWVVVLASILFFIKEKYEYLITFFWGLIGYSFVLVITFLYFFSEFEGKQLASYERYMGVYFLAFAILAIKIIYEKNLLQKKYFLYSVTALIIIAPVSPRIFYPPSIKYFFTGLVPQKYKHKIDADVRADLQPMLNKITTNTPLDSRVWLIWQHSMGYEAMILRYDIVPRKMNMGLWSIGEKYSDGDVWTANLSKDEVVLALKDYDYMALGFIDEKFINRFGGIFTSTPVNGVLYKKEIINNEVRLVVVQ